MAVNVASDMLTSKYGMMFSRHPEIKGSHVKMARRWIGLTQRQLAYMMGMHITTIKRWEKHEKIKVPHAVARHYIWWLLNQQRKVGDDYVTGWD